MSWFTGGKASQLPADMLRRLELLGRYTLDRQASGIDSGEIWSTCLGPFLQYANTDLNGLLAELRALIAADQGGFATLGAAHLVWELCKGDEILRTPAAWPLIDAGIDFKLARGLPTASLTGYEMQRLVKRRDTAG